MRLRYWWPVLGGALTGALCGAGWAVYTRRSRLRRTGPESIDDPALVQAFSRVAGLPPMRLMRRLVAARAATLAPVSAPGACPTWLDLGCGPGLLVLRLARQDPAACLIGVDLSDELLDQARERARAAGLGDRATFKHGDAGAIPLPDASVDVLVSTLSLHHWQDARGVLDEIARVLRPGGAFLVFDLRRDLALPAWLLVWFVTHIVVPAPLRRANEPLASRDAAYTAGEVAQLAQRSRLRGWRVTQGPLWLTIEGSLAP